MQSMRRRQMGLSLMGFIIILSVVGFFAYLFMRIYPAYYEYYNVRSAMEQIAREPAAARWTPGEILTSLEKRMYISYVDEKNVNKRSFQIKRAGTGYTLAVKYEVRSNLLYNLDYVAMFEKTVTIGSKMGVQ
jgi:Domain of unknown function (DUF4845)